MIYDVSCFITKIWPELCFEISHRLCGSGAVATQGGQGYQLFNLLQSIFGVLHIMSYNNDIPVICYYNNYMSYNWNVICDIYIYILV